MEPGRPGDKATRLQTRIRQLPAIVVSQLFHNLQFSTHFMCYLESSLSGPSLLPWVDSGWTFGLVPRPHPLEERVW